MKKKHDFFEKKLKLTENNTFNNVLCSRIFSYYSFLSIFKKKLDFPESWFTFLGGIFSTTLPFHF